MNYGIVVSDFNPEITEALLAECVKGFKEQGIEPTVIHVPGAVEIPLTLQAYIEKNKPSAMVALGCVIKGDTEHYDLVCRMCGDGIMEVMLKTGTPIIFEVLMVDEEEKAKVRTKKGYEAAFAATEMAKIGNEL
ncbi:MAG: 6,7-dimethyl-8-ribityllumazine synthase [Patescibacteria group bacterium]